MNEHNKGCIIRAKEILVELYHDDYKYCSEEDASQIFYIIQLLDYLLLGTIPINSVVITNIMEEIITTSIYSSKPRLLKVLNILKGLEEDTNGSIRTT